MTKRIYTRTALALAGVIALLLLVSPVLIGGQIQSATVDTLLDMVPADTARALEIRQTAFDRGWFSSTARIEVSMEEIDQLVGEPVSLNLNLDISHGPLLFTPDGLRLGLAFSDIHPELTGINLEAMGIQNTADSTAENTLDYTEPRLTLLAAFDNSIVLNLILERLTARDPDASLDVGGLRGTTVIDSDLSGKGSLELERLEFNTSSQELDLLIQNMSIRGSQSNISNALATGNSEFVIREIRSDAPLPLTVRQVHAEFLLAEEPDSATQLSFSQDFSVAEIDSDLPLDSIALSSELKGLDRELLENYMVLINQYQQATGAMAGQADARLAELTQGFLLGLARERIEFNARLDADAFGGSHNAVLALDWLGLPSLSSFNEINLRDALAAVAVVLTIDADQQALLNSPLGQAVFGYAEQGLLSVANGRVSVDARLVDGILSINDETLPIDQLINIQ